MNAKLFVPQVADHNRLTAAKRAGAKISFCERTKLLTIDGHLLGYPSNLRNRENAEAFAKLHNIVLS